ncbi:MAG: hypothetical protein JXR95_04415 [Deltaproteobacteria bacterium]|nr:hypothetical protein [Deltaproteobacteria bacterium]
MTSILFSVVILILNVQGGTDKKESIDCKASSRNGSLSVKCLGSTIHVFNGNGSPVGKIYLLGVPTAVCIENQFLIVAIKEEGVRIFKQEDYGYFKPFGKINVKGFISRIQYLKPYLFILRADVKASIWKETEKGFVAQNTGKYITKSKTKSIEKTSGNVVSVIGGEAKISLGEKDGLSGTDRVEIFALRKQEEYDPISGKSITLSVSRSEGVLKIIRIGKSFSFVKIGLNQDIKPGDIVRITDKKVTLPPENRRWKNLNQFYFEIGPGIVLGDLSIFTSLRYRYDSGGYFSFRTGVDAHVFKGGDSYHGHIHGAFTGGIFEVGIGIGYQSFRSLYSSSGVQKTILNPGDTLAELNGFMMETFARLGSIDGNSLELGIRASSREFRGFWLKGQKGYSSHFPYFELDLSAMEKNINDSSSQFDDTTDEFLSFTIKAGDRILIFGNSGPNSLFININFGAHILSMFKNSASYIFSLGLEYRF